MGTKEELRMLQALPLDVKILKTQQRIREWVDEYGEDGCYVSRSGGKDSDVLGDIVKKMYPNIPHVFCNTGLEYNSVREHAVAECDEVLKPEMSFVSVIKKYGYPVISKEVSQCVNEARIGLAKNDGTYQKRIDQLNGDLLTKSGVKSAFNLSRWKFLLDAPFRISEKCCDVMKKSPFKKYEKETERTPLLATMAEESRLRRSKWVKNGCNSFDAKRPSSAPMSFWVENDIMRYIHENNIKIADAYGEVTYLGNDGKPFVNPVYKNPMRLGTTKAKRTGCTFCLFGISHDNDRLLKLKEMEPQKYEYIMRGGRYDDQGLWVPDKGLGYKFVIDWLNKYGDLDIRY